MLPYYNGGTLGIVQNFADGILAGQFRRALEHAQASDRRSVMTIWWMRSSSAMQLASCLPSVHSGLKVTWCMASVSLAAAGVATPKVLGADEVPSPRNTVSSPRSRSRLKETWMGICY